MKGLGNISPRIDTTYLSIILFFKQSNIWVEKNVNQINFIYFLHDIFASHLKILKNLLLSVTVKMKL